MKKMGSKSKVKKENKSGAGREIAVVMLATLAVFLILSLVSFHPDDPNLFSSYSSPTAPKNLVGIVGASVSWAMMLAFGIVSYLVPFFLLLITVKIARDTLAAEAKSTFASFVIAIVAMSALVSMYRPDVKIFGREILGGGLVGKQLSSFLIHYFNSTGAWLLLIVMAIIGILLLGNFSLLGVLSFLRKLTGKAVKDKIRSSKAAEGSLNFKVLNPAENKPEKKQAKAVSGGSAGEREKTGDMMPVRTGDSRGSASSKYTLPSADLLDDYPQDDKRISRQEMAKNARILEEKLADFGVYGKVTEVCPGPVVTMYEYRPAAGIKISRVVGLADDLAMALRALSVRVIAPLPEKAAIGIEIPNKNRELVSLKELVTTSEFAECPKPLSFVLGKDVMGKIVMADLAKMPHLLIAGATGTGKSVCINTILASFLFRCHPDTLKLLLIDPKRIELNSYQGIPHLLHPVVTDVKMATNVLRWAVAEMERRYELLADLGVRNIDSYNDSLAKIRQDTSPGPSDSSINSGQRPSTLRPFDPSTGSGHRRLRASQAQGSAELEHKPLPFVVIVIDELSDLMMVASKEVEELIIRLAQMARAAGIHLILATQRPSVDVITGLIKANIPSRISFQVSSRTDSRTILDTNGAEMLLGDGDMLFLPPGTAKLQRIHGAFISDREVNRLTDFLKKQQTPEYDNAIAEFSKPSGKDTGEREEVDEKYEEALEIVRQTRQASISMLQRKLRVGYNRAARMIEMMEKEGIVGPSDGSKPREVYLPPK